MVGVTDTNQRPASHSPFGVTGDLFEHEAANPSKDPSSQSDVSEKMKELAHKILPKRSPRTFQKDLVIGTQQERIQVFLQIALPMLQQEKQVLFLVPEVHHVEHVLRQLKEILGESIEVYHGKLPTHVRADSWERIRQGRAQVVLGTRSALFVPLPDLGLIWVDQEEDASYKDERLPYYHAREVSCMRGVIEKALVVYGSSCPSLETYRDFREEVQTAIPTSPSKNLEIHLIDMQDFVPSSLLTPTLVHRLTSILNEGQQAILILNRKGFSSSLICTDCGQAPACETCGVALRIFHRPSRLMCAYCRRNFPIPETCPSCLGTVFRFSGVGTQHLEEELTKLFPSHLLFRFDRDHVKTMEEKIRVLKKFRQGDIHILIGTEILLHLPDPPKAKLVALTQADLGLHHPDFRAAERTFLLLSRAHQLVQAPLMTHGPSGELFIQTRMPHHYVFQSVVQHNPHIFYQEELDLREALAYPPAAHILLLVITGRQTTRVQQVVAFLEQQLKAQGVYGVMPRGKAEMLEIPRVLGPLTSQKPGRSKKNRTIFLIKTFNLQDTQRRLRKIQQAFDWEFGREPVVYEVHVDPLDIQ